MERTATQCITYGLYMLSTVWEKKANGCIIDTCMQISHEPVQIAIAVSNQSYTCELLKKSGIFAVSILDETCTFETIKHFGYQSGRDVDKMKHWSFRSMNRESRISDGRAWRCLERR